MSQFRLIGMDTSGQGFRNTYQCDDQAAVVSLPTAGSLGPDPGSMAFCERNNNNKKAVYYLKLNRTWALLREEE